MIHLALYEPEIPPNTGNIMRLSANTGCALHLIQPLGFTLDDKLLRRAGLDYHEFANVKTYASYDALIESLQPKNIYLFTTKGLRAHSDVAYEAEDLLVFGPETRGLPDDILSSVTERHRIRIPMVKGSRSLNLSNAAAVAVFEAWRQLDYDGSY
jgi:tRNA (cytidine/uridine-2'-O-)-methyltransferase